MVELDGTIDKQAYKTNEKWWSSQKDEKVNVFLIMHIKNELSMQNIQTQKQTVEMQPQFQPPPLG